MKSSLSTKLLSINDFITRLLGKILRDLSNRVHLKSISKFNNKVINRYCFFKWTLKNRSIYKKNCLLITLLMNLLIIFKWTLLERFLRKLLRSLLIKSLIDNIFIERLGLRALGLIKVFYDTSIYSANVFKVLWGYIGFFFAIPVNICSAFIITTQISITGTPLLRWFLLGWISN